MLIDSLKLGRPLDGEVALITGAGGGIGKEAALALAALGASIAIAEVDDTGRMTERAIWDRGGQARFFQVDVSDPTAMESLQQQATARFNHVDIVVNNAAVFYAKPLVEHSTEEWDGVMAVNLRAAFLTARLFLPSMVARRHGIFITMESGDGMPFMAPYFASKVALRSLASSIGQELAPDSGVSVFCFGAGMVDTPGLRAALPRLAPLYRMTEQEFIRESAPGGVLMTAEECGAGLAGCVLHAARFHGQETAAVAGLELLGLRPGETPRPQIDPPSADLSADRRHAVEALDELIADLRHEHESLGIFQRRWYKRTLKQRSGLSLDEWQALSQKVKNEPDAAPRVASDLKKLAEYFSKLESDARGYIRDPEKLESAIAALEARRSVARKASDALRPRATE